MNNQLTPAEREHVGRVKALPCSVCGAPGPSEAHHIKQHRQYTVVALCKPCHGGPGHPNGWHGDKSLWRVYKMDELDALNATLAMLETGKQSQSTTRLSRPSKVVPRRYSET